MLRSHHHPPSLEPLHLSKLKLCLLSTLTSHPSLPAPGNAILLSVSISLTTLGTSCKWDHTMFVLLWLTYFIRHSVPEAHPCCSAGPSFATSQAESHVTAFCTRPFADPFARQLALGWLPVLAAAVDAAVNVGVQTSRPCFQCFWGTCPVVELLDHTVVPYLIF